MRRHTHSQHSTSPQGFNSSVLDSLHFLRIANGNFMMHLCFNSSVSDSSLMQNQHCGLSLGWHCFNSSVLDSLARTFKSLGWRVIILTLQFFCLRFYDTRVRTSVHTVLVPLQFFCSRFYLKTKTLPLYAELAIVLQFFCIRFTII